MAVKPIYLDYNATTPIDPNIVSAMLPYLNEYFGNPSSGHIFGQKAREAVEKARNQVAEFLDCNADETIFTSGGTESNNHAIRGLAFALRNKGNHIITTQIEHPSVLEVCKFLESDGFKVTYLPVDEYGLLSVSDVEEAIKLDTILITTMHANNEVGTIQPVEQISRIAKKHGIIMHTDAAQSAGKISIDVNTLGIDLLSIAGHKLYAPKGVGALYVKRGIKLEKFMHGAGQERGRRASTENVIGIVGLGEACEITGRDLEKNAHLMVSMRDRLHDGLKNKLKEIRLNGPVEKRLPNTLSLSFKDVDANVLIDRIKDNLAVSAGAACHSGSIEVSHVLKAMNVPIEWARGTLRFSAGRMTTKEEVDKAIDIVTNAVLTLRENRREYV
ncbi:MAG: IscS subfamily cysteine desulfurase [Actinobacteria bacterium]|nr:IscS subfamily cysteine desulfurase [Actinomycetota bacterium]